MSTVSRVAHALAVVVLTAPFAIAVHPAPLLAQAVRPLTLEDYGEWKRIRETVLSPDGRWLSYAYVPNDGDATLYIEELDGDRTFEAVNGADPEFSDDSRFVAFMIEPTEEEREKRRQAKQPVERSMRLIDLTSGATFDESRVERFAFSSGSRFLAVQKLRTDREAEHTGSDLVLRELGATVVQNIGNVAAFAFDEGGAMMAYTVDAAEATGNGLYVLDLVRRITMPLDTRAERYHTPVWSEDATRLAVLRGDTPDSLVHRVNTLVVGMELGGGADNGHYVIEYDPVSDADFPEGMVLSEKRIPTWTDDGSRVLVGIDVQEREIEKTDDPVADVDVWHWADTRVQSVQKVQASRDRDFTYLSAFDVGDRDFVRLADDDMRSVEPTDDGRWGIGTLDAPYRGDLTAPPGRADYYRVDLDTGTRSIIDRETYRTMGSSPDGRWFLFLEQEHVIAEELATGKEHNLSEVTGIDFINREFDRPVEQPAYGVAGWSDDGGRVLLNDRFDVWSVPLDGGESVNLTGGMGAREQIRFRIVELDPDAETVDLTARILLSAYGERTKKSGYFRARPGRDPEPLIYEDEMIGNLQKAERADRVIFTRQTFERFPDYWVADLDFGNPRRVTNANPQIAEFAWGRRVLIDYVDERGHELQATLALPAGYEPGRRYPMIIYFYEKMSQRHHQFSMPVYDDRPHMSTYASNGYLVLMPDIVFDTGLPGSSALDDVTSAARRVIELGYADPARIGLQGHSWGGYESSFILTQTDMFAAVVTGAPLTNLVSMHNIIYKRTGSPNGPILEWSQGRMATTPYENLSLYQSQSPIHYVQNIATPFLILHGTEDGAVDWNQAFEFYWAAKRVGKEVILLSYPGEPHHLNREENQKDFQIRMKQYFDHHLKDAPAPTWMTEGVPFLEKERSGPSGPR